MYSSHLVRTSRFWEVSVQADNTAVVSFGYVGSKGRSTSHSFANAADADMWAKAAVASKISSGYASSSNGAPSKRVTRSSKGNKGALAMKAKKVIAKRVATKPLHTVLPVPSAPVAGAKSKAKAKKGKKNSSKSDATANAASPPASTAAAPMDAPAIKPPVDAMFPDANQAEVVGDFDATLNQTNIGDNNNKYYRIQLLKVTKKSYQFFVWTRWGRVGESYSSATLKMGPFMKLEKAMAAFENKFLAKTGNHWANRANFVPKNKKYELLEVDYSKKEDAHVDAFAAMDAAVASGGSSAEKVEYLPSKLDSKTRDLVSMLFEKDVYAHAMQEFGIDTRRMPLGQLTSAQILRGVDVLKDIDAILRTGRTRSSQLPGLSSRFYSVIPHDFGRQRPPLINNATMLQKCFDKCNVLLDIEKATKLMSDADKRGKSAKQKKKLVPHPTDGQYDSLQADLALVEPGSDEHSKVMRAFNQTSQGGHVKLMDVWRVDRHGEDKRFSKYSKLKNHKLLWHGTNIAVVAAILSSGLRIMPHSGGRCGSGIYLASEADKSQGYTSPSYKRNIGCMFLAEAALGKEFSLLQDDSSLRKAPNQFDSVVARGRQTPASFEQMVLGSNKVMLPIARPVNVPSNANSYFDQDEYLVYREEQVRLRYVLTVKF